MKLLNLVIENFRCIGYLNWNPSNGLTCIVGAGDSGKTTILDAIELVLGTRWFQVSDTDFLGSNTENLIKITVIVGDLSEEAKNDKKMGLHLMGWNISDRILHEEPEDMYEPVVKVQLTIDHTFEPEWKLVNKEGESQKTLSTRERAIFGLVRLGSEIDRHFTWNQRSALMNLITQEDGDEKNGIRHIFTEIYKDLKKSINDSIKNKYNQTSKAVEKEAIGIGAYLDKEYRFMIDMQRALVNRGALALHDGDIPVRLAGLGTRRLVSLAIERLSAIEGKIILIDEVEQGLEPHRIRRVLKAIRDDLDLEKKSNTGFNQVIITTHSPTAVVELQAAQLTVANKNDKTLILTSPGSEMQALIRRAPEAFLGKKIIVCEGKTEIGLLRGLRDAWKEKHNGEAVENYGVVFVDGNGEEAKDTAVKLAKIGFDTSLFRDSDINLKAKELEKIINHNIKIFEWPCNCSTEKRVMLDIQDDTLQDVLDMLYEINDPQDLLSSIASNLNCDRTKLTKNLKNWDIKNKNNTDYRKAIAETALSKKWFKRIDLGEKLGEIIATEINSNQHLFQLLRKLEDWIYER